MKQYPAELLQEDKDRQAAFFAEVWELCGKYGYDHYFMVAGEPIDEEEHSWIGNLQEPWYEGTLNAVDEWIDILREKYGFERGDVDHEDDEG